MTKKAESIFIIVITIIVAIIVVVTIQGLRNENMKRKNVIEPSSVFPIQGCSGSRNITTTGPTIYCD